MDDKETDYFASPLMRLVLFNYNWFFNRFGFIFSNPRRVAVKIFNFNIIKIKNKYTKLKIKAKIKCKWGGFENFLIPSNPLPRPI